MNSLFTETDPYTGLTTEFLLDGKNLVERTTASAESTQHVLDHAARLANDADYSKNGIKAGWWHAATIPAEVWLKWAEGGFDIFTASTPDIMKKLRDPDYKLLRTTSGKF